MSALNTFSKLVKTFESDRKNYSASVAWARFSRDFPVGNWEKKNHRYEDAVYRYIYDRYRDIFEKYRNLPAASGSQPEKKYIWVMWWDGVDHMPPIVRTCYDRLCRCGADAEVVLITKDNYTQYVQIPDYILKKVEKKQITLTHFSDILRMALVRDYGGMWIDATVYTGVFPEHVLDLDMFTLRNCDMFHNFIFKGKWSSYLFSFKNTNSVFTQCAEEVFLKYWTEHDSLIEYLLIDYVIKIMVEHIPEVARLVEAVPTSEGFYDLNPVLNEPYDEDRFRRMMESPLQKLTYKKECFPYVDGQLTMYGHIMGRE